MLEIVVSHYNNIHFEKFLTFFNDDTKIIIYDKSNSYENTGLEIKKIKNEGREGETYLRHIIENYDNLSEYTLFIQDDTNNHIISNKSFYNETQKIISDNIQFYQYKVSWREGGGIHTRTINNGNCVVDTFFPSRSSIKETCSKHNIYLPTIYITETCAFFIVHKNVILKRPKEFYINLRLWLLEDDRNGYVLEHIWYLIFC